MTRRSARPVTAPQEETQGRRRTQPAMVGQGREIAMASTSIAAIAAASIKAGFPNPFAAEALTIGMDVSNSPDLVTGPATTEPQTPAEPGAAETSED